MIFLIMSICEYPKFRDFICISIQCNFMEITRIVVKKDPFFWLHTRRQPSQKKFQKYSGVFGCCHSRKSLAYTMTTKNMGETRCHSWRFRICLIESSSSSLNLWITALCSFFFECNRRDGKHSSFGSSSLNSSALTNLSNESFLTVIYNFKMALNNQRIWQINSLFKHFHRIYTIYK